MPNPFSNLSLMSFFSPGGTGALREESSVLALRVALVQRNAPCIFARRDGAQDPYEVFDRLCPNSDIALSAHTTRSGRAADATASSRSKTCPPPTR